MSQVELFPESPKWNPKVTNTLWHEYLPNERIYRKFSIFSHTDDFHPDRFHGRIVHLRRSDILLESWKHIVTIGWHNYIFDDELVRSIKGESIIIFYTLNEVIAIGSSSVESIQDSVTFNVYKITRWSSRGARVELETQNLDYYSARSLTDLLNAHQLESTLYALAQRVSGRTFGDIIGPLIEIAPPPSASHIPHIRERYPGVYWLSFHDPADRMVVIDDDSCLVNPNLQLIY